MPPTAKKEKKGGESASKRPPKELQAAAEAAGDAPLQFFDLVRRRGRDPAYPGAGLSFQPRARGHPVQRLQADGQGWQGRQLPDHSHADPGPAQGEGPADQGVRLLPDGACGRPRPREGPLGGESQVLRRVPEPLENVLVHMGGADCRPRGPVALPFLANGAGGGFVHEFRPLPHQAPGPGGSDGHL